MTSEPPKREILNPTDMAKWLKSEAYQVRIGVGSINVTWVPLSFTVIFLSYQVLTELVYGTLSLNPT